MELWILVSGWEGKKMTDRKICMEDGTPLSEELIHIEKPEFELVQREQEIRDANGAIPIIPVAHKWASTANPSVPKYPIVTSTINATVPIRMVTAVRKEARILARAHRVFP